MEPYCKLSPVILNHIYTESCYAVWVKFCSRNKKTLRLNTWNCCRFYGSVYHMKCNTVFYELLTSKRDLCMIDVSTFHSVTECILSANRSIWLCWISYCFQYCSSDITKRSTSHLSHFTWLWPHIKQIHILYWTRVLHPSGVLHTK